MRSRTIRISNRIGMPAACESRTKLSTRPLLGKFACEPIGHLIGKLEAGELPGETLERQVDAVLPRARLIHREPQAEVAQAVLRIRIELPDIAERVPVRRRNARRTIAEY